MVQCVAPLCPFICFLGILVNPQDFCKNNLRAIRYICIMRGLAQNCICRIAVNRTGPSRPESINGHSEASNGL